MNLKWTKHYILCDNNLCISYRVDSTQSCHHILMALGNDWDDIQFRLETPLHQVLPEVCVAFMKGLQAIKNAYQLYTEVLLEKNT